MNFFDWFSLMALAVFLAAFIGRTVALSARGTRVFVIGAGKHEIRAAVEAGAIVILLLLCAVIVTHSLHARWIPEVLTRTFFSALPARISGAVLIAFGIGLFLAALASFGASWRIGIDKSAPGALMTGGAFGISRNPAFFGMDLIFAGTFLIYPTWIFLALAAIFVIGAHFHILEEERFLREKNGSAYAEYRARVPRYLL